MINKNKTYVLTLSLAMLILSAGIARADQSVCSDGTQGCLIPPVVPASAASENANANANANDVKSDISIDNKNANNISINNVNNNTQSQNLKVELSMSDSKEQEKVKAKARAAKKIGKKAPVTGPETLPLLGVSTLAMGAMFGVKRSYDKFRSTVC